MSRCPSAGASAVGEIGHGASARHGQIDVEHGAAARRIGKANLAVEAADDLLDDAQAQAGAAFLARVGIVGLREFLEHARPELVRNPGPVIAHRQTDAIVAAAAMPTLDFAVARART